MGAYLVVSREPTPVLAPHPAITSTNSQTTVATAVNSRLRRPTVRVKSLSTRLGPGEQELYPHR
ncbi:hypothetical protein K440DRAFT_622579 [Wilcoxina mikolae CBS 423.85]|nr:hypothetical protein K440DRAFT_622579 [Wilcoxina mikolae CBS 423.85]